MADDNPFQGLKRLFHEPSRLSVVSFLSGTPEGLTFTELKERTGLTDGNLSRHIKTLENEGIVAVTKEFVDSRPCTTVALTETGREQFHAYLKALESVLIATAGRVAQSPDERRWPFRLFPRPVE